MAQAATMGPPLSPREIRRSGRRSAPSASTSNSKSPDADIPPRQKDPAHRPPPPPPPSTTARNKRSKDDQDDHQDDRKQLPSSAISASTSALPKGKRKNNNKEKEKDRHRLSIDVAPESLQDPPDDKAVDPVEEEEQGITRCVCGSNGEDETDAGEFMVQCETCKVWQHGLCMGYESEDQVHDADYYCEQCRPELHAELLRKLAKKARQSSAISHGAVASRVSRSHSPHLLKQPSKRRNTMNSRDAAFDESLREVIEATAAEAAAAQENAAHQQPPSPATQPEPENEPEVGSNNRKKRKRTDDDASSKKRTRSASSASDQQPPSIARPPTPPPKSTIQPTASTNKPNPRTKRTGRKTAPAPDTPAPLDGDETAQSATTTTTTTTTKRQGGNNRAKASGTAKRPPISQSNSHGTNNMSHESVSRRGQLHSANGQTGSTIESSTRAYRNSHAYAVAQQPLFTSWGLPDYLAHLEEMLPSNTPQPLEIQSGGGTAGAGRGESVERTMERGVKVKWPSKRMSVGDMNKRVRALVEWVGREQANALDRERRREALEKALKQELEASGKEGGGLGDDHTMAVDGGASASLHSVQCKSAAADSEQDSTAPGMVRAASTTTSANQNTLWKTDDGKPVSTMKMMEELMEELIGFQERFGPGAKIRERERRITS